MPYDERFGPYPPGRLAQGRYFELILVGQVREPGHYGHLGIMRRLLSVERVVSAREIESPAELAN